jgi:hypothetical protein
VILEAERLEEALVEYWMRFWSKAEWPFRWLQNCLKHYAFLWEAQTLLSVWEEGIWVYLQADFALIHRQN